MAASYASDAFLRLPQHAGERLASSSCISSSSGNIVENPTALLRFDWTWLRRCRFAQPAPLSSTFKLRCKVKQDFLLASPVIANGYWPRFENFLRPEPVIMGKLDTAVECGIPSEPVTDDSQTFGTQRDNDRSPSRSWASPFLRASIGGLALFSDGYNAQVVGYMNPVLTSLYPDDYTSSMKTRMSNAFLIGEVFGMLFFGWAIDRLGRRQGIIWATVFLVLGIVLTTAASGETDEGRFWMMIIGRGVAGFGAGGWLTIAFSYVLLRGLTLFDAGEYPTCATTTTEATNDNQTVREKRGIFSALTTCFAVDAGFVAAGIVVMIVLAAYGQELNNGVWRVSFGIGLIIPVALLFFRLRMLDSEQYVKHAIKDHIPYGLVLKRYWKAIIGTSMAWFMYDFVVSGLAIREMSWHSSRQIELTGLAPQVYPFGIFSSTIISGLNPEGKLIETVGFGTAINSFFLPGCIIGGLLMDKIGRRQTMTLGFVLWSILGFIIGGAVFPIMKILPLFIVLYGIFNGLGEMGPGVSKYHLCTYQPLPDH
jgi:MFS family permease